MPEMRAESSREAKRKGIAGATPQPEDPNDLTSLSKPAAPHTTTRGAEHEEQIDPTGAEREPDPASREERLRPQG